MTAGNRLVVFDVDGTLVDSQDLITHAMGVAFAERGRAAPPREIVRRIVGLSLPEAIGRLAPGLGEAEVTLAIADYKAAFVAARVGGAGEATIPLYPGARAALDRLAARDGVLMGVATGKARRGLDHVYAAHDLAAYFRTHQTGDRHPSKPHPAMLHAAMAETGVEAARTVMVGDTTFDIEMGRAAGVATIGVAWGYHGPGDLDDAGADLVIHDFDDLDAALASLWASMP